MRARRQGIAHFASSGANIRSPRRSRGIGLACDGDISASNNGRDAKWALSSGKKKTTRRPNGPDCGRRIERSRSVAQEDPLFYRFWRASAQFDPAGRECPFFLFFFIFPLRKTALSRPTMQSGGHGGDA
ncbi:hypothetical protein [Pandoravirus japonicus]|uniref:Uncharacterized protein n=1 Tax=Pandoravirus japonicus TaxID=2823154 RepID=A0A811BRH7_9VIRU|nr:hypothetical protein [Pandoravirus japonicus]